MKEFISGVLVDTTITAAALAGVTTTVKKTVTDPIGEEEDMIEENRKKAIRKHTAR